MDEKRFRNSPAGKLVKVGRDNTAYWAFVPNPLPPTLVADWGLTARLSEADRAISELAGLGRSLPNPSLFISPFLRREAVLSSRIEGTQSDISDLYYYEAGQLSLPGFEQAGPSEADLREVFNYVRALEFGLERLQKIPISLRLFREMHQILLANVRGAYATPGEFRTRQNWIGGRSLNEAVFVPPPVKEMQTALDSLEKYLYQEDVYPPLVRLAFIHYQFEAIHPFVDGNGRIGRLLLALLLVAWGLLPLPLLYLSAFFEAHRQVYYERLLKVSEEGDWRSWVDFVLEGVQIQSQDAVWRVKRLQDLQHAWYEASGQAHASGSVLRLLDFLFASPILSIPQVQEYLGVTYRTASRNVEKMVEMGFLRQLGESNYDRRFVADAILNLIIEDQSSE